jgi:hypothetical protein
VSKGSKSDPHVKDPDDTLDYIINWNGGSDPFLGTDTIDTSTWIVPTGITNESETNTDTTTTIWLSGGTVGTKYALTNRIVTFGGRIKDRTIYVKIKEQ